MHNNLILVGMKDGTIGVVDTEKESENEFARMEVIMKSHCDGECWGLEVIHLPNGEIRVITSADDNRILAYNLKRKLRLAEGKVCLKPPKKKKSTKRGASSMSN